MSLLGVIVLALSFVALTQNRTVADAGSTPGASAPPADPSAPPAEAPAPAATSVAVPTRVLAAIDTDAAVRVVVTDCPAPSMIEVTADGGATWEAFEASSVSTVQRITAGSDAFVSLIGLAVDDCAPTYEQSFTGGAAWQAAPDELDASWFVDPADRAGLHSPARDRAAPCAAVVQLAVVDESSAAALCDDGSVHATVDAGATWLPSASVTGAAAIGVGDSGYRVAVVNQNGCVGAQLVELALADSTLAPGAAGACLAATAGAADVALASGENVTWLWVGDSLARSEDGGASWL